MPAPSSIRVVIRPALVGGLLLWLGASLSAQEAQPTSPEKPITETAERISRQLWPTEVNMVVTIDEDGRPRFRSGVAVDVPQAPWTPDPNVLYYRPFGGANHSEFLYQVTPEGFRAGALYPCCFSTDPASIVNGIKSAWRSYQEKRIRERIQKEVDELRAASDKAD
jgi:hypothetical protein